MPQLVPELREFHSLTRRSVLNNGMILDHRPERSTLTLSLVLTTGSMVYSLGETPASGVVIKVPLNKGTINLLREDIGDLVGAAVWNITGGNRTISYSEVWHVPTDKCICPEPIGVGCPPRDDTYAGNC